MTGATDVRKAEIRLSRSLFLKRDHPLRDDKFRVRLLSDQELIDWKTRCIEDVQTEIVSQLKHPRFVAL